jgi:hypothetical protein
LKVGFNKRDAEKLPAGGEERGEMKERKSGSGNKKTKRGGDENEKNKVFTVCTNQPDRPTNTGSEQLWWR